MRTFVIFSLLSLALAAVRFDGDQVLTLFPTSNEHIKLLQEIDSYNTLADFWKPDNIDGVQIGKPVDIRFKRESLFAIKQKFRQANLRYNIKIIDLQQTIDNQFNVRGSRVRPDIFAHDHYHPYEELNDWTIEMANMHDNVERSVLEISEEGREIPMLTITDNPSIESIVLIDCGFHAREWITPAFCHYFVEELVESTDSAVANLRANLKFVVVPVANVDGYAYSWTDDRMWRKTRSNYANSLCFGVDPNRNFNANFGGLGASPSPCSDTYHGPYMESEKLTQGITKLIEENVIDAYLTVHSYGQYMLYPYSKDYTSALNKEELDDVAANATAALKQVFDTEYVYGPGATTLYPASGGSDDMAQDFGAKLSYTLELRDKGRYGFLLPEDQIIPTSEETFELVRVVCEHVISKQQL